MGVISNTVLKRGESVKGGILSGGGYCPKKVCKLHCNGGEKRGRKNQGNTALYFH